jgi:hypothetical protein
MQFSILYVVTLAAAAMAATGEMSGKSSWNGNA